MPRMQCSIMEKQLKLRSIKGKITGKDIFERVSITAYDVGQLRAPAMIDKQNRIHTGRFTPYTCLLLAHN